MMRSLQEDLMSPTLSRSVKIYLSCILLVLSSPHLCAEGTEAAGNVPAGYPDRTGTSDILRGFKQPPPGYGDVAFDGWLIYLYAGTPDLADGSAGRRGVTGLQVNYAHTDTGGYSYGKTMKSAPPLFSEQWWDLFRWLVKHACAGCR